MIQLVFDDQTGDAGKFSLIVGDNDGADGKRLRGDPCVVSPDRCSLLFKKRANPRILSRRVLVDPHQRQPLRQGGQTGAIALAIDAFFRAELQFAQHDRRQANGAERFGLQPSADLLPAFVHRVGDETERAYRRSDALDRRRQLMEAWSDFVIKS